MQKLTDLMENPSGFDSFKNYAGEIPNPDWLVLLTRSRDSDILTESNFAIALERLGGESDDVEVFRFGHWACGWWEVIGVREGTGAEETAREIAEELEAFPILSEEDFSRREEEEAENVWRDFTSQERIQWLRKNSGWDWIDRWPTLRAAIRGEFFPGYASDLIR